MSALTAAEAGASSRIHAQAWAEENADILTCFNPEKVNSSLLAYFQTRKRANDEINMYEICQAFVYLVDRGVLVPEFSLRGVPQDQLDNMRATIAPRAVAPAAGCCEGPAPNPAATRARELDECVQDFANLDSKSFKTKWMGVHRAIYDGAVAAGRI